MYLSKVKQPVTVFEIIDALRKKDNIDQATVYRNLLSLHESGLIRRLDFNHGSASITSSKQVEFHILLFVANVKQ